MSMKSVLLGVLWVATVVAAGFIGSTLASDRSHDDAGANAEKDRIERDKHADAAPALVSQQDASGDPKTHASKEGASPASASSRADTSNPPESNPPESNPSESNALGAAAWITVAPPATADGEPIHGVVYAVPAKTNGDNDLAMMSHAIIDGRRNIAQLSVPAKGRYDIGFVPNMHGWWTVVNDIQSAPTPHEEPQVTLTVPNDVEPIRVSVPAFSRDEIAHIRITARNVVDELRVMYPGRQEKRNWVVERATNAGGDLAICQCMKGDEVELLASMQVTGPEVGRQKIFSIDPSQLGAERTAKGIFGKPGRLKIVLSDDKETVALRLRPYGHWRVRMPYMPPAPPLFALAGTHDIEWRTQSRRGVKKGITLKAGDVTTVSLDLSSGDAWKAPIGYFASFEQPQIPYRPLGSGAPGAVPLGGIPPLTPPGMTPEEPVDPSQVVTIHVDHPVDGAPSDAAARRDIPGVRNWSQAFVDGDTGQLALRGLGTHIAVVVSVNPERPMTEAYASTYHKVKAGESWNAKLKRGGYLHVVRKKPAPRGAPALLFALKSGGPLPRVMDEASEEPGAVAWTVFAPIETSITLGPFQEGKHTFEAYMGKSQVGRYPVTIRSGELSVLIIK